MYSYSRENQQQIMEEIPIFTWEITTKCSQIIFPQKDYLMEDLILLKKQDCYVYQSSYYTFKTEDLSKARKGMAEKKLSLLNSYIGIQQIPKKVKNIPKRVKQLNERNSKRQHVAELLQQNFKNNIIAQMANVNLKEVVSVQGMIKKGYGYTIGESIRKSKFTPEMKKWIEINCRNEKVNTNSASNIRKIMLKELKLPEESISLATFIRHLGKTCNLSYKNVSYPKPTMDSQKTKEQRYYYALELIPPLLDGYIPIFIDEAGISMGMNQTMAWIPRGERLTKDCPTNSEHYTILGAVTPDKILAYMMIKGFSNQYIFLWFLSKISQFLKAEGTMKNHFYVFDQASSHESQIIQEYFFNKVPCFLTPRSSPQLNPIELLWSLLKNKIRRNLINTERDLLWKIYDVIKFIPSENLARFYRHSMRYLQPALTQNDFGGYQVPIKRNLFN
ncbi:hypothetical protein ABPG74_005742 [Tetrahymena malaccensis]